MVTKSTTGFRALVKFLNICMSSIAFLMVAFLSAIAGYALAAPDFSFEYLLGNGLPLIITYLLLLLPYYASRHGLLERKLAHPDRPLDIDSIRFGIEFPSFIVIGVVILAYFSFRQYFSVEFFGALENIVISLFLGLVPFFLVFIASLRNLVSDETDRAFRFTERVLYPALCTGIIPFSFGWSLAGDTIDLHVTLTGAIFVTSLIIFAKLRPTGELLRVSIAMGLLLAAFAITMLEELRVIVLGTVILLAMGVSEASKRIYQATEEDRFFPETQGPKYYLAGSNWSSIVFLWLLCLVPLLNSEIPTYPFMFFIITQSLLWLFLPDRHKSSRFASIIALLFGYALPLIIILIRTLDIPPTFLSPTIAPGEAIIGFALIVALASFVVAQDFSTYWRSRAMFSVDTYLDRTNNNVLFFIVVSVVMIITVLIGIFSGDRQIATKASEIILFGSVIVLVLGIYFLIRGQLNGATKKSADG